MLAFTLLGVGLAASPSGARQAPPPDPKPEGPPRLIVTANTGEKQNSYDLAIVGSEDSDGVSGIFYRSSRPVYNPRIIEVTAPSSRVMPQGSNRRTQLALWNELDADGKLQPHRAIRQAGSHSETLEDGTPPRGNWDDFNRDEVADLGFVCIGSIDYQIKMRYAVFNPVSVSQNPEQEPWPIGEPALSKGLAASDVPARDSNGDGVPDPTGAGGGGCHVYIVQFWTQTLDEYREMLASVDGTVLRYLPCNSYVVQLPSQQAVETVLSYPAVRWVEPFHPVFRLDEALTEKYFGLHGEPPSAPDAPGFQYKVQVFESGGDQKEMVAARIRDMGGHIVTLSPYGFHFTALLLPSQIRGLLGMDQVAFIEERGVPGTDMNIIRAKVGADYLAGLTVPFTGRGVRAEVVDENINTGHIDFRSVAIHSHPADPPFGGDFRHGTTCFGIMFGTGANAVANSGKGLLPDAGDSSDNEGQGFFAGLQRFECRPGGLVSRYRHAAELVGYPGYQEDPQDPINLRVVLQSNSWGCGHSTQYTCESAEADDIVFQLELLWCQSQGNLGSKDSDICGPNGGLSRFEAWAKNVVSVGGVTHSTAGGPNEYGDTDDANDRWWRGPFIQRRQWTGTGDPCTVPNDRSRCPASKGPASDDPLRIKPDLCGYYDYVGGAASNSSSATPIYTCLFGGTSAAAPVVAGCFGLFYQMWHEEQFPIGGGGASVFADRPRTSCARAMLINTAFRYSWDPVEPNYPEPGSDITRMRQGWGRPNLQTLYDRRSSMLIVNETEILEESETASCSVYVDGSLPLLITMVYTDPPACISAGPDLVNDLNLAAISPTGQLYYGNLGLLNSNWSSPKLSTDSPDSANTVENIFIQNPAAGNWQIFVTAHSIAVDGHQEDNFVNVDFSLVVTGISPTMSRVPTDWNDDGTVDASDVFSFIASYFNGNADVDKDGDTTHVDWFLFINGLFDAGAAR